MDLEELQERAAQGLPLYGTSHQPEWVQQAANRNSQWSQLKFCEDDYPYLKVPAHLPFWNSRLSDVSNGYSGLLNFNKIVLGLISCITPTMVLTQQSMV